jgi:lysozyme
MMHAGPSAYALIRQFEGLRLDAYCCPAGVPTIGYGSTERVQLGMKISLAQAEDRLRKDVAIAEDTVRKLLRIGVNQNQFDALVSFVLNLGAPALQQSTLLKRINAGDAGSAANEFCKWVFALDPKTKRMVKLPGLVTRRAEEAKLFLSRVGI